MSRVSIDFGMVVLNVGDQIKIGYLYNNLNKGVTVCKVAHETLLILNRIPRKCMDLIVCTNLSVKIPDMLKVNEGFHHDLNAIESEELRGPTFPC